MKFSFIIPAFNEEKIISECINSLKNQKGNDFEIIVVDNGSEDKTAAIALKSGVKVIYEKNRGIANARNKGAKTASGEYLCFIDADGAVSNNWLTEARNTLKKKNIRAIVGLNIFNHKNLLKKYYYNIYTFLVFSALIFHKLIFGKLFLSGNNLVIKRYTFLKLGGFEPYVGEDYYLTRKFWRIKDKKSIFNPKMVIYYSSRGFEKSGFLKTIAYWILASLSKTPQDNYSYKSKKFR